MIAETRMYSDRERDLHDASMRYHDVVKIVRESSARMRGKLPVGIQTKPDFTRTLYGYRHNDHRFLNSPLVWVTDRPTEIFSAHTAYHVTSELALESLRENGRLDPPMNHGLEIVTHRGVGNTLLQELTTILGIDRYGLENFIWLGSKVDWELVRLTAMQGKQAHLINNNIFDSVFTEDRKSVQPELKEILRMLAVGKKPKNEPQLVRFIDHFMANFFQLTGTRDGWFDAIKSRLSGDEEIPPDCLRVLKDYDFPGLKARYDSMHSFGIPLDPRPSRPVILTVDTRVLFQSLARTTGIIPIEITRDPQRIISASFLPVNSIKGIHIYGAGDEYVDLGIPIADIRDFPESEILRQGKRTGKSGSLKPSRPICIVNYQTISQRGKPVAVDTPAIWREHLMAGRIAPMVYVPLRSEYSDGSHQRQIGALDLFGDGLLFSGASVPAEMRNPFINQVLDRAIPAGIFLN